MSCCFGCRVGCSGVVGVDWQLTESQDCREVDDDPQMLTETMKAMTF